MTDLVSRLRAAQQAFMPIASTFSAPDAQPNYTQYACSYHWFRGPDGRAISLDVIRSDDSGNLGLRVVRERADGGVDGLSHITPKDTWMPMRQDGQLDDCGPLDRPLLSRGENAIAGRYEGSPKSDPGGIHRTRFALRLELKSSGYGSGHLGLGISHLVATDFLLVHYQGFVEINGEHLAIDSLGSISLHAGDALPQYAYLITLPQPSDQATPRILLAAVYSDTLRIGSEIMGPRSLVYAYGCPGHPLVAVHVGEFDKDIPLGLGNRIEISDVRPFLHDFLGAPTCTASVHARYVPAIGAATDLGRAFIDYRGEHYMKFLNLQGAKL